MTFLTFFCVPQVTRFCQTMYLYLPLWETEAERAGTCTPQPFSVLVEQRWGCRNTQFRSQHTSMCCELFALNPGKGLFCLSKLLVAYWQSLLSLDL